MTNRPTSAEPGDRINRSLTYVPELDGLRAVAVLAVLLFHFSVAGFSGGYVGVDVFFVLSGFLISKILIAQRLSGEFSYASFYLNRFWRLFPALLATVLLTYLIGGLLFSPYYFEPLSESALATIFSVSNFYFWANSGYFDQEAVTKPLLHTWSLGVEEQFYLIWPMFLGLIVALRSRRRQLLLVLGVGLMSLAAAEYLLRSHPAAAFYLMPFRTFEFAIGTLVALLPIRGMVKLRWLNDALFLVAAVALAVSISTFDADTPFPGRYALLPGLASGLLLITAERSRFRTVLANAVMIYIGRISYSLYLVHWPVVAYFAYLLPSTDGVSTILAMALVTWVSGHAMHRCVERPFRYQPDRGPLAFVHRKRGALLMVAGGFVLTPAVYVAAVDDLPGRYDAELTVAEVEGGKAARFANLARYCRIDEVASRDCYAEQDVLILVLGNSHEPDALNIMSGLLEDTPGTSLIYYGNSNGCVPLLAEEGGFAAHSTERSCQARVAMLNDEAFIRRLDHVVYSARYGFSLNKRFFLEALQQFRSINPALRISIFSDYLHTSIDCAELTNRYGTTAACKREEFVRNADAGGLHGPLQAAFAALGPTFISKWDLLCTGEIPESCETETPAGVPMFYDRSHLSYEFARYIGRKLRPAEFLTGTGAVRQGFAAY